MPNTFRWDFLPLCLSLFFSFPFPVSLSLFLFSFSCLSLSLSLSNSLNSLSSSLACCSHFSHSSIYQVVCISFLSLFLSFFFLFVWISFLSIYRYFIFLSVFLRIFYLCKNGWTFSPSMCRNLFSLSLYLLFLSAYLYESLFFLSFNFTDIKLFSLSLSLIT